MQIKLVIFYILIVFAGIFTAACKKSSDNNNPSGKTKTELITSTSWKFDNAKLGSFDVSGTFDDCLKDNTILFSSNGTGSIDEGATKCDAADPQTTPFNWAFENNETTIHTSTPLFPGTSDFTVSALSATQLAFAQDTVIAGISQTITVTLKH